MRTPQSLTSGPDEGITALNLLTPREREVARLIALGHTNAEVGSLLQIHQKTVETHRNHIMTKLGLRTRADLVRFALAQGLVNSGPRSSFFQSCPGCSVLWALRSQFLSDREVRFDGYQSPAEVNSPGAFRFHHERCGTPVLVPAETFIEMAGEPLLASSCGRSGSRVEYCLADGAETGCPLRCVCAFVWRTSQLVKHWPKG